MSSGLQVREVPLDQRPVSTAPAAQGPEDAYAYLLGELAPPAALHPGMDATPRRAVAAMRELLAGYTVDPAALLTTFEDENYSQLVAVTGIPFFSLCEHHLLPFHGTAAVGYIPQGRVLGLSKLARVVEAFARRLQVQERLTEQVADLLAGDPLNPKGVVVHVRAEHLCMTMRGVQKPGSVTTTTALRGSLLHDSAARAEALGTIRGGG